MTTATGTYKGFTKNDAGFITLIIEGTGLEVEPGKTTKYFNGGKIAPKTPSNIQVSFEYSEKPHSNGKTYYDVKGAMKELGSPAAAQSGATVGAVHSNSTNSSIENQVALKAAVEVAIAGGNANSKAVESLFTSFQNLLQPKAAAPKPVPKPKPVEDQSQDPDDDSLPPY